MKIPIPLNSSLCTDSHKNEIKNPQTGNDLFSKNRSYLINSHITNPKKKIIPKGDYITTRGNVLTIDRGSIKTRIFNGDRLIADVLSLGIEDTAYLDKDDAVIHDGSLWTVEKTLDGYVIEQTDLISNQVTKTEVTQDPDITSSILDVRFIRNTHKIITRNDDGSIRINGVRIPENIDPDTGEPDNAMANYFTSYLGEFIAVEINGKVTFGLNNPAGVKIERPSLSNNFNIDANVNSWVLSEKFNDAGLNQNKGYTININIGTNVIVGANNGTYALDLVSGMLHPELHIINITMGAGAVILGHGGNGGNANHINNFNRNGQNGGSAIFCGSELNISGLGGNKIQGGGGGGGGFSFGYRYSQGGSDHYYNIGGSGGGGSVIGNGGTAWGGDYNSNGNNGNILTGGSSVTIDNTISGTRVAAYSGAGGDLGQNGNVGAYITGGSYNTGNNGRGTSGLSGKALVLKSGVSYTVNENIDMGSVAIV